jgi:hypothetical protein
MTVSHTHDHNHDHGQDHNHDHDHDHAHSEKDPAEQVELAKHLGEEISELFVRYVQGDLDFAEITFATYDMLQDLHIIAMGEYELEYDEDDDDDADEGDDVERAAEGGTFGNDNPDYDRDSATDQQEDLAQEPART